MLVGRDAPPDPEVEAPPAEKDVEHRDLVRQADRVPPGGDDDSRADVDALGAPGPVREVLQRVRLHRIGGAVVFGGPDRIEPEWLDESTDVKGLLHLQIVRDLRRPVVIAGHQPGPIPLVVAGHHHATVHAPSLSAVLA